MLILRLRCLWVPAAHRRQRGCGLTRRPALPNVARRALGPREAVEGRCICLLHLPDRALTALERIGPRAQRPPTGTSYQAQTAHPSRGGETARLRGAEGGVWAYPAPSMVLSERRAKWRRNSFSPASARARLAIRSKDETETAVLL